MRELQASRFLCAASMLAVFTLAGCASSKRSSTASTPPAPQAIRGTGAPNEIPAGSRLEVRTNELITSTSSEGTPYAGEVATDVVDSSGQLLLPKGAPVELVLMETRQGRGIKGSSVQLGLRSVTVN